MANLFKQIDFDPKSNFSKNIIGGLEALQPFPNTRMGQGITNRDQQIISWRLPNSTTVQMYINPQSLVVSNSKQISTVRTKGGYVIQYWGNELSKLTITGTTGSSGIRGIQVLEDIYNAENRGFELVAAAQTNSLIDKLGSIGGDSNLADSVLPALAKELNGRNFILRPSLAVLASNIVMFYQGTQYRGFFNSFNVDESTDRLGLFNYTINFTATETRGRRSNFLAWHKEPLADDLGGQLINGIGNAIRGLAGLASQPPEQFHPENSPLSFGGNSLAAQLGFTSSEQQELTQKNLVL